MSKERFYPKGLFAVKPHENAPSFVKGGVVMVIDDFYNWMEANHHLFTEYKGKKQIKFQITENREGKYVMSVDTFVPTQRTGDAEKQPEWDGQKEKPVNLNPPGSEDGLPF